MVPRHVAHVPICRIPTLPLDLFPSSCGLFVLLLALASLVCLSLHATCGALDTDHRCITVAAKICNLALRDSPIRGIVIDGKSINNQTAIMSKMP